MGIKQLKHIVGGRKLLTFDQHKDKYNLPNWYFFRYIQLRHSSLAQFSSDTLELGASPLELMLVNEVLQKPLPEVYKELFVERPKMLSKCKDTWSALVKRLWRGGLG